MTEQDKIEAVAEAMNRRAVQLPYDIRNNTPMAFYREMAQVAFSTPSHAACQPQVNRQMVEALTPLAVVADCFTGPKFADDIGIWTQSNRHGIAVQLTLGDARRAKQALTAAQAASAAAPVGWRPVETAPKDGTEFIVLIGGLPYKARYDEHGRFIWYMHLNRAPGVSYKVHQIDGETLYERLTEAGYDCQPTGVMWKKGFEDKPTHWMPLPNPPQEPAQPQRDGGGDA